MDLKDMDYVIELASDAFQVPVDDIMSRKRSADVALCRQTAMYALYITQKYTLLEIGVVLGGRTPATVSHGFQTVAKKVKDSYKLKRVVDDLLEHIHEAEVIVNVP